MQHPMYYKYLGEILTQIVFWTEISKEHPIVINTFTKLSAKNLPYELVQKVFSYNRLFEEIQDDAKDLAGDIEHEAYPTDEMLEEEIFNTIRRFLALNPQWIRTIQEVKEFGQEDMVWQTLLQHMTQEQMYAQNVVKGKPRRD